MRRLFAALLLALSALPLSQPGSAREVTTAEQRVLPYVAELPGCEDPSVLSRVTEDFAGKEAGYWGSPLAIVGYEKVRPVAFRPWGLDTIPRRFCEAVALLSDGRPRRVNYSVRESLDFIGTGYGVEWCVVGLDRNWAFAPACRMARP